MKAVHLLAEYERIADAPDAVTRLRRFVLDLAVRGKLVPQNESDAPETEVLRRASTQNVSQGDLPRAWVRATVGALLNFQYGKGLNARERKDKGPVPIFGSNGVVGFTDRPLSVHPSIIVGRKGSAGALNLCKGSSWTTDVAYFIEAPPFFEIHFLLSALTTLDLGKLGKGVKPGLSRSDAYEQLMCVPPLAEQHRIVAKVEELMGLCDRLEATRAKRETSRDRFTVASLAPLNAPDPQAFRADSRFALDNLAALTVRRDQITQLRQTILNLAVRGRLVQQDRNDEPASELPKGIADERDDLVRRGLIRRERALDPIPLLDPPFDVPHGWVWSRIGDAVLFTQYGTSQKSQRSESGVPVLTMGNVQDGLVVWGDEKKIPKTSEELPALFLSKFDLLYNRTNSAELVGKTGIYLGEDSVRTFASYLIRLRPSLKWTDPRYLNTVMNTPHFRQTQILPLIKKQTGQANVNGTALKNMLIPLPPLAEQHRIVATVDELTALCVRLEASIASGDDTRRRLLEALLHDALDARKAA